MCSQFHLSTLLACCLAPGRAEPTAVRRLGSLLRTPAAFPFLALLQGTVGTPRRCLQPLAPSLLLLSFPQGTQVLFSCGKKAACLSPGTAGPCPLSCGLAPAAGQTILAVSWGTRDQQKCVGSGPGPVGGFGPGRLEAGPSGSPFLQGLHFLSQPCPWGANTGQGGGVEPPERDAEGCV